MLCISPYTLGCDVLEGISRTGGSRRTAPIATPCVPEPGAAKVGATIATGVAARERLTPVKACLLLCPGRPVTSHACSFACAHSSGLNPASDLDVVPRREASLRGYR